MTSQSVRPWSDSTNGWARADYIAHRKPQTLQILSDASRLGIYPEDHLHFCQDWLTQWCQPEEVLDGLTWGYRRGFRLSGVLWYLSVKVNVPHPKAVNPYKDLFPEWESMTGTQRWEAITLWSKGNELRLLPNEAQPT